MSLLVLDAVIPSEDSRSKRFTNMSKAKEIPCLNDNLLVPFNKGSPRVSRHY
jgi:hypothetical protein